MHIAIDVREACRKMPAGKGRWTEGFVSALLQHTEHSYTLYTDEEIPSSWIALAWQQRSTVCVKRIPSKGLRWHWLVALDVRKSDMIDLYVSTVSFIAPLIIGKKKRVCIVVHDLIAFMNELHNAKASFIERATLPLALRTADSVLTVSDTTKSDLLSLFPHFPSDKVRSIYAAVKKVTALQPHPEIILCMGTLCPRKNQLRLIQAFKQLPDDLQKKYPLVLVGARGWRDADIIRLATETKHVQWRKYVPDIECESLYERAAVLAFPSLYEGFGLPILEAFMRGIPVLTSARGSMQEVAGEAAFLVDPNDVSAIAAGLYAVLTDVSLQKNLREKGFERSKDFSWDKTAELFFDAI